MVYTIDDLKKAYNRGEKFEFLFFWGHTPPADGHINESCLSQWWMCNFIIENVLYSCAEQYMMAEKARMFRDEEMLQKILHVSHPKEMKKYGRAVKSFDKEKWDAACYEIVKKGNTAKFEQNPELWDFLKCTRNRILVEASPRDSIWGIGMAKTNPDVKCPLKWKGTNLLGFALTQVRDQLLEKENMEY